MSFSLHAATVPSYLQILRGTANWLDKAESFGAESGRSESEMMDARLAPDMFPFNRQVRATAMHSQGAIEGCFKGQFSPDLSPPPDSFAGLKERLGEAIGYLEQLDPAEFETLIGKPMRFVFGSADVPWAADQFLLSFSMPNFYFHTTTAYAIMRAMGCEVGKMDYLAGMRTAK
ncbi:DUF1993 family protein [Altererythrobacter salegens]|uniref:DUF1993 family protein n=1 Tax=Croceibacterium salegens TaxID=1737568 RepID=A0A6I4T257_9SPHN|nr:DUF1993 domain-containing protein [Croceibacterium salegens]MXO61317.1 DUF1993 family protein [Croceibacterium salegens]